VLRAADPGLTRRRQAMANSSTTSGSDQITRVL
jgi:hypothetical protein